MSLRKPSWRRRLEDLLSAMFEHPTGRAPRALAGAFLALLFLFGVRAWGIFYSWGGISFDFLDWVEVAGPRYALLRSAAEQGVLPLNAASVASLRSVTDRYFSIADTPFSPQYLLLPLLPTGRFIFLEMLTLYAIGFVGLLLLYRRFRLSPFTFALLFLLFTFNGYIVSHLAVGHTNWIGYFLLPYFALLVFQLLEQGGAGWGWVLGMSLLLLAVLLQGFFHMYLFCLIFLALLALFQLRLWKPVALAGLFTVLVSLPRLLPPSLELSGITPEYLGGFASLANLVAGLVELRDPYNSLSPITETFPLQTWETDFYVGLLGFALLVGFGVAVPLLRQRRAPSVYVQVLLPCFFMTLLSMGTVFGTLVRILPAPPFTGERVTSRMWAVPMVMLLVLAVVFFQRWLEDWRRNQRAREEGEAGQGAADGRPDGLPNSRGVSISIQILLLGLAALLYHDLSQHTGAWRIRYLDGMIYLFPKAAFDPALHVIANHPDPVYTGMLLGGSVVALASLALLGFLALRERRTRA